MIEKQTPKRLLRIDEVKARVGICKSGIYAAVRNGKFPRPVKIGVRTSAWSEQEIDQWIEARCRERDVQQEAA